MFKIGVSDLKTDSVPASFSVRTLHLPLFHLLGGGGGGGEWVQQAAGLKPGDQQFVPHVTREVHVDVPHVSSMVIMVTMVTKT